MRQAEAQQLGQRLADELLEGGDERETGLPAAGGRVRLALSECVAEPAAKVRITPQTVVVASGGARGVTAAALLALAKAQQPQIALLGRTALAPEPAHCVGLVEEGALRQALLTAEKNAGRQLAPKALAAAVRDILARREILETLAQLRSAGSVAEYWACDASDAASVQSVLAQVRKQLGPIRVLVHGAGVLADKLIAEKPPSSLRACSIRRCAACKCCCRQPRKMRWLRWCCSLLWPGASAMWARPITPWQTKC
ncbi:hypothetical protein EMGBS3_15120 [Anaerolineaceae bacterium]|nr:hypothetical protein EMGBS3_15120 [Anaerolineaceae bacterium]